MAQAGGNEEVRVPGGAVPVPSAATDPVEFFIPSRNVPAILAYYLGIFAFIPVIGIFLGIPALILGIKGRRLAMQRPEVRGKVHAWVGIIMGAIFGVGQLLLCLAMGALIWMSNS